MAETKVSVRSDLLKIAEDLKIIAQTAQETSESLGDATKEVGKTVDNQVSIVDGGFKKLRQFGKDLTKQLGSDFKSLFSVNALAGGMKISEQFGSSIKQAVTLNDTLRNLSPIFGMNEQAANRFKSTLVKNLSEIGVGSDAAANALQGLAETNVRGDKNLSAYATTASELAGISKQKGQEGQIAKGMAGVVVAQGGNPNDPKAMQKVAEDIVRIRNATGRSATEALDTMNKLFSSANTDFKKKLLQGGGVSLAAAGLIGGQGSTAFLERFMGLSKQGRAGYEAQGLGRLIGSNGQLDNKAFQSTVAEAKSRGSGNAEFGLQTMGMSEEEAKGFLRLSEAMKANGDAVERARTSVVDINQEYQKTMSLGDSFHANINKVKGGLSEMMEKMGMPNVLNKATDTLQGASHSTGGAAAVVGGSALLAAVLTGGGLKGIGGSLLGGEAKKKAIEGITGEKVQMVQVTNWPSSLGGMGGADMAKKAAVGLGAGAGLLVAGVAAAGAAAFMGGQALGENSKKSLAEHPEYKQDERGNFISNMMSREDAAKLKSGSTDTPKDDVATALNKLNDTLSGQNSSAMPSTKDVRVMIETKGSHFKVAPEKSRGISQ